MTFNFNYWLHLFNTVVYNDKGRWNRKVHWVEVTKLSSFLSNVDNKVPFIFLPFNILYFIFLFQNNQWIVNSDFFQEGIQRIYIYLYTFFVPQFLLSHKGKRWTFHCKVPWYLLRKIVYVKFILSCLSCLILFHQVL